MGALNSTTEHESDVHSSPCAQSRVTSPATSTTTETKAAAAPASQADVAERCVQRYYRRVLGNEEEIRKAVQTLGHEPANIEELQDELFRQRQIEEDLTAEESKYSYY